MKFSPTYPQIALIVVLFAGVIAAYTLAPGAATVITGMATTLIGWLCSSPLQGPEKPDASNDEGK